MSKPSSEPGSAVIPAPFAAQGVAIEQVFKSATTISGQILALPQGPVGVTVFRCTIAVGTALPSHRHAFPRYGYVLAGTLRLTNEQTGSVRDFIAGDFIIESIAQWHSGRNVGSTPLCLLVIDQVPEGVEPTEPKPADGGGGQR